MTIPIGIIAEDNSDLDVIREIINKLCRHKRYSVKKFLGYGCGKIISKSASWAYNLHMQKCQALIVVHDLDDRRLDTLCKELSDALSPCPIFDNIVVIPVREIEAWLLTDSDAISRAMKLNLRLKKIANPEAIFHPKETLEDLVYFRSGKQKHYINSIHNKLIAREAHLTHLRRCRSFIPLESFLVSLFG